MYSIISDYYVLCISTLFPASVSVRI